MAENKMEQAATIDLAGAENPFLDLDVYFLEALLTGEAEIVRDEK